MARMLNLLIALLAAPRVVAKWGQRQHRSLKMEDRCTSSDAFIQGLKAKMNMKENACDNFYEHSCGAWIKNAQIPASRTSWDTFSILADNNYQHLKVALETDEGPAGQYFKACMDEDAINASGKRPLVKLIQDLDLEDFGEDTKINYESLAKDLKSLFLVGTEPFFGMGAQPNPENSHQYELSLAQGSLTFPLTKYLERDDKDESFEYLKEHIHNSMNLMGIDHEELADAVLDVENELAKIMMTNTEMRDPRATYNPTEISTFAEDKKFPWAQYITSIYGEHDHLTKVDVNTPKFFQEFEDTLERIGMRKLRMYMYWNLVSSHMSHLSRDFYDESFQFSRELYGIQEEPERWETCTRRTEGALGDYCSALFVKEHFSSEARRTSQAMIKHVKQAFKDQLDSNTWMDAKTKETAKYKCDAIREKIGYPDYIKNSTYLAEYYKDVESKPSGEDYFSNHLSTIKSDVLKDIAIIVENKSVDKERWDMTMATVNAYYDPTNNEIVFPSGILQPPFFDHDKSMAFNFGAIGLVMGHELTHGFDDQGRQYDAEGNMVNWWREDTLSEFKVRTKCLVDQYSQFSIYGTNDKEINVNGNLTLGENIADNGGIHLAIKAYRTYMAANPQETECETDFTPEQLYFYGFAQVWCEKAEPSSLENQVLTDPHSPAHARVLGATANSPEFKKAFCQSEGEALEAEKNSMCNVW
mmetsp:Transcript_28418/g.53236  ORF Transcript_28418/g.53236 Transcript_28418/m.53236 type:complete len:700 (-) Transcript_28418:168-2267(-)